MSARMTDRDIANERTRLLAGALNTAAASSLTLSVVAPVLALLSCNAAPTGSVGHLAIGACFGLFVALALHRYACQVLEGLRSPP
jgi:hypothetical protein